MQLVKDHSDGAYAVSVPCLACGRMLRLADSVIDTDGPAFRAYYHPTCVPGSMTLSEIDSVRCSRNGCARC